MKTLNDKNILKNPYIRVFILGFICALCLFLPFLVVDKGFFMYAGDYNSQQIPFHMYLNNIIKQGNLDWSWATDLGTSVVNGYSFYILGSPFFWLSCLFPYRWEPYVMPFLLMLKFAVATLGAFCWMRRYSKSDRFACIGALLYAFSGFSVYNIFFNHFLEVVALFPFMLWALDEFMLEKRRGLFVVFVALNLVNNYFFFIGQVVFLFIYFICKVAAGEYLFRIREFFLLAFESVLGCLCGIVLFVPNLISIVQNPRSIRSAEGFGLWMYSRVQQYFAIALSAFFPPESPYAPHLFTDASVKWTSMTAFVVLGGLFGYFVFLRHLRKSAFTKIFSVCIVFAFVPILNSSFYAFNSSYYARWYYMPVLILAAMNMHSFTMKKEMILPALKKVAILTAAFCVFALTPSKGDDGEFVLGLQEETALFWLYFIVAAASIAVAIAIVKIYHGKADYSQKLMCGTLALVMLFGIVHMSVVKLPQVDNDKNYIRQNYDVLDTFDLYDDGRDYRVDAYQCYNNLGLYLDIPVIQFFNSTVNPSIMEFYPYVDVKRDVSSKPEYENYALRSLLSVKYIVMPTHEYGYFTDDGYDNIYSEYMVTEPYQVLKNDYFIPMGFTYDYFITPEQMENINQQYRSKVMLKALMVEGDVVDRYKLSLEQLPNEMMRDYSFDAYCEDVDSRKTQSSYYFEMTKDGFESAIKLDQPNLVFYSVPYDEGFTAYVNGVESEVIKVHNGLCAVYAPAGDNHIVFSYRTVGLGAGIALNCAGIVIYAVYLLLIYKKKVKI
ncbi:MAG: YfhO family protein [Oscillospiraceae bacterium]|nr:YfhO family protein [Oscillospiraceae bacterium]